MKCFARNLHKAVALVSLTVVIVWPSLAGAVSRALNVEAVTDYTINACNQQGWTNQNNAVTNVNGFVNMMLSSNPYGYYVGQNVIDGYVWETDFLDGERTVGGKDHVYFDSPGVAFSFFSGHGGNPAGNVWRFCRGLSDCYTAANAPPPGATDPRFCRRQIGDQVFGLCTYTSYDRAIVVPAHYCAQANYSSGAVKWGESPQSTGWAGAGTNGGTNVVVLQISHAHNSQRTREVWPAFAGIHMLLSPLNHEGDTADTPWRGYYFAYQYYLYPWKSVVMSWLDSAASIPYNYPTQGCCAVNTPWESCGFGINGCGGHIAAIVDSGAQNSLNHFYENWLGVQDDAYDAVGTGHWRNYYRCNWNCDATGFER